jgi:hypothetical protein
VEPHVNLKQKEQNRTEQHAAGNIRFGRPAVSRSRLRSGSISGSSGIMPPTIRSGRVRLCNSAAPLSAAASTCSGTPADLPDMKRSNAPAFRPYQPSTTRQELPWPRRSRSPTGTSSRSRAARARTAGARRAPARLRRAAAPPGRRRHRPAACCVRGGGRKG